MDKLEKEYYKRAKEILKDISTDDQEFIMENLVGISIKETINNLYRVNTLKLLKIHIEERIKNIEDN